jgi:hypothetical protein
MDYQYKVFIGKGNNSRLLRGLLKRRFWWTVVDKLTDDVNFVWTQLKVPDYYEKQSSSVMPQTKKCLTNSQSLINCTLSMLETSANNF